MALIEINKNPTRRELRWFGVLIAVFFGLLGAMAFWRSHTLDTARVLWTVGVSLGAIYYAIPPLRRWLFLGWMYAAFPIGWTISHIILAVAYYLMFTPIGLLMRLFGRDALQRRFNADCESYWIERETGTDPGRYFKQF